MRLICERNHKSVQSADRRRGFTLVELLVVIAIIGILVALLLPAIQAAREAARRSQCKNQVKNIALGCLLHVDTHGFLPSGGWGRKWSGDPNRGYGENQPGSWAYNILTYVEEAALHDLGKGKNPGTPEYIQALQTLNSTPVELFYCPTRRPPRVVVSNWTAPSTEHSFLTALSTTTGVAKTDYAINSGASRQWDTFDTWFEPTSYAQAATGNWSLTNFCEKGSGTVFANNYAHCQTGVSYYRSQVKPAMITDGTSKTYLVGEGYKWPEGYESPAFPAGTNLADNQGIYSGMEWDNHRVAHMSANPQGYPPSVDSVEYCQPRQDTPGFESNAAFGSAHPGGLNMSMCDGSVQTVAYDIDPLPHRYMAMRFDGETFANP
jgi:prepilin-type N-terminal cleavage/methylation domain-containing protein/prepilin-type processing-associated H-X9-DG protein